MTEKKKPVTQKQMDILDAAIQAFQELGYDNASMDYIAEVASASKRTVYNHFPSKNKLFQEVLNRFIDETAKLKQIMKDPGWAANLGHKARERIRTHYSWDHIAEEFENFYSEQLAC